MNTKKITALALAALMAAGTTATAFADVASADKDKVLVFATGTAYEENDDGLLVEDKDGVNPGDSIFYRLEDNSSVSGIVDKDRERINVYADWKLGKDFIEDVDIIYRKGSEIKAVTIGSVKIEAASVASLPEAVRKAYDNNEGAGSVVSNVDAKYAEKTTGYTLNKKYLADADALLSELAYTAQTNYEHSGVYYVGSEADLIAVLTAEGYKLADGSDDYWSANAARGYGTDLTNSDGGSMTQITDYSKLYVKGTNFVDLSVDTVNELSEFATAADTTLSITITDNSNGYVKGDKAYAGKTEAQAAAEAETGVVKLGAGVGDAKAYVDASAATDVIATTKDAAITWAIDEIIKAASLTDSTSYTYWVEIKTKDSDTTKEQDLAGTLYLGTTKNAAEKGIVKLSVDMTLSNRVSDYYNANVVEDEYTFDADSNGVVKFASTAEEVTLYFGENEDAWFTFNAQGQSALNFAYTTKFNKEIADLFPKANIDFITWTATPATNRTGDLYITADEDTFLYEVTEDGIKEVNGAKYDEDEGAWHIRTRKLAAYVISDMELDTSVKLDNDSSSSTSSGSNTDSDGNKANPDTGR